MFGWLRELHVGREKRRIGRNFRGAQALRAEVQRYDAARCARLVEDLVGGDHDLAWVAFQGLQEAPPAALGALIAALDDDRFLHPPAASVVERGHILAGLNKPLPRVLRILAKYPSLPTGTASALRRLSKVGDRDVAAAAARLLDRMDRPVTSEVSHSP